MTQANVHRHADLRHMTVRDLAQWGMQDVAFVKRVTTESAEAWSIHAADGSHIGLAPEREVAFAAVRQHDLEPLSVH